MFLLVYENCIILKELSHREGGFAGRPVASEYLDVADAVSFC